MVRLPTSPPTTAAESKELKENAAKARAAYASMTPEEKAMYKKGMRAQKQWICRQQEAQATNQSAHDGGGTEGAQGAKRANAEGAADPGGQAEGAEGNGKDRRAGFLSGRASNRSEGQDDGPALFALARHLAPTGA